MSKPAVFISYARQDLGLAKKFEQALTERGFSVWRDQESIYAGENWPKAIGEAISSQNYVLLFWSRNAGKSHFVEFEWTTAIALRKSILPCLLDETPLPPSLTTYQGIPFTDFEKSLGKLLNSLEKSIPESDIQHNQEVISNLEKITPGKPEEVIEAAKHIFKQHGWTVLGDFYQAARDINITVQKSAPGSSRNFFEKWQFVAFLAAALTVVSLLLDLPAKIGLFDAGDEKVQIAQSVSGTILDKGSGNPLTGVYVHTPEFVDKHGAVFSAISDSNGRFSIPSVLAFHQESIRLVAQKQGYKTYRTDATLANPKQEFHMEKMQ